MRKFLLVFAAAFFLFLPGAEAAEEKIFKIAVLPWKVSSAEEKYLFLEEAVPDMLASRIGSAKGAAIAREDVLKKALQEFEGKEPEEASRGAGERLGLDYVLYGSITIIGDSVSLDAKLLDLRGGSERSFSSGGKRLDSVIGLVDKLSENVLAELFPPPAEKPLEKPPEVTPPPPPVETAPPAAGIKAPEKEEALEAEKPRKDGFIVTPEEDRTLWKSGPLEGLYVGVAAADLDGNGETELFLVRKSALVIAHIKEKKLEVIKEIGAGGGVQFIAVSAIDSDGDGAYEVFVSGISGARPSGIMVEFRENGYRVTATGIPYAMRAVSAGASPPVLVGQKFRKKDFFYGDLRVLRKSGNEVVDAGPFDVKLPRGVGIYSFDAFDLEPGGALELVTLDRRGFLRVMKEEEGKRFVEVFKSEDFFGGTLNLVEFTEGISAGAEREFARVENPPLHTDTDGDGRPEIIVRKNTPGGVLGRFAEEPVSFKSGSIFSLALSDEPGEFLREAWRTKDVDAYIADFLIGDIDGDGRNELLMLTAEGAGFFTGKAKSYILLYRLSL